MALHCFHCGEKNLRDEAQFCDRCGASLTPLSQTALNTIPGPTPGDTAPALEERDEVTRFLVSPDEVDEGGTRVLDEAAVSDGVTQFIPQAEITNNHQPPGQQTTFPFISETPAPAATFHPGYLLQGRYRLEEVLGMGGFGTAYLAEDVKLERRCVVKWMLIPEVSSKELEIYRANFEREAKLLAELNDPGHPNIPEIYDYFSTDNGNYLVMKYIEGHNLAHLLVEWGGKIAWRSAVGYLVDVCGALNYMHTQHREPVMHRDIKPANIIVGEDRRVWLVDFGLAKADPVEGKNDLEETLSAGSLGYTPYEQWIGQAVPASDIYALGATLHYLVTGINPREAYQGEATIEKVEELHGNLQPIRELDPELPAYLEEIISRMTAIDPEDRPTALQLRQQLLALISEAQSMPLFTFKNGTTAKTVEELVDLCDKYRPEAVRYLYQGDFERWFSLINRNDLAGAAHQAVRQHVNRKEGLERFLKLILPNLAFRRLLRTTWRVTMLGIQVILTAIVVLLLVAVAGSYGVSWFVERSIGKTNWDFTTLDLEKNNIFTERFLSEKMDLLIGAYLDQPQVELHMPDRVDIKGRLIRIPLTISTRLQLGDKKPHLFLTEINDFPLGWFGENISQGINRGIADAFNQGPVDVTQLTVEDRQIIFKIVDSPESHRPPFATATPTPTPSPTPTPTPTPVPVTLVVISNDLPEDVILEVISEQWSRTLEIAPNSAEILETPPGTYRYTVKYKSSGQVAAQGVRDWVLNKAYRIRIDLSNQQ